MWHGWDLALPFRGSPSSGGAHDTQLEKVVRAGSPSLDSLISTVCPGEFSHCAATETLAIALLTQWCTGCLLADCRLLGDRGQFWGSQHPQHLLWHLDLRRCSQLSWTPENSLGAVAGMRKTSWDVEKRRYWLAVFLQQASWSFSWKTRNVWELEEQELYAVAWALAPASQQGHWTGLFQKRE